MNILNFKRYKKLNFLILFFLIFLCFCDNSKEKILRFFEEKSFDKLNFRKECEITLYHSMCYPLQNSVICIQALDTRRSEYKIILYDYSGNLVKENKVRGGEGPDEILAIREIWSSDDEQNILCIDGEYLKSIDPEKLTIKTVAKLSNLIKDYRKKYIFAWLTPSFIETEKNKAVVTFESTGFEEDLTFYIVRYEGLFRNIKIIHKLKKRKESVYPIGFKEIKSKRRIYVDYYHNLRPALLFSVHWKSGTIYYIPEIESPEIEVINFYGKDLGKYRIDIDFKGFKIGEKEFEFYYDWVMSDVPPLFNDFKHILYKPSHAPPLQGIKVIDDWLLIITGKRDWEKGKNWVLVYQIPSFQYEGSFYIPFPEAPALIPKWNGRHYIVSKLLEKDGEYYSNFSAYCIGRK